MVLLWLLLSVVTEAPAAIPPRLASQLPTAASSGSGAVSINPSVPLRVRVRIAADLSSARVRGFDLRIDQVAMASLPGESARESRLVRVDQRSEWDFVCRDGAVVARSIPDGKIFRWPSPLAIRTPSGFLHFQDQPYREEIRIYAVGSHCEAVNHLELEHYLNGLVNAEFSAHWNEEAIGAQVIVARTYAYYQIEEARKHAAIFYDLDATTRIKSTTERCARITTLPESFKRHGAIF